MLPIWGKLAHQLTILAPARGLTGSFPSPTPSMSSKIIAFGVELVDFYRSRTVGETSYLAGCWIAINNSQKQIVCTINVTDMLEY